MVPRSGTVDDVRPGKCAGRGVGRQQDPVSYRSPDSRLLKKFFQVPKFSGRGGTVPDRGGNNVPAGLAVVRNAFRGRRQISFLTRIVGLSAQIFENLVGRENRAHSVFSALCAM